MHHRYGSDVDSIIVRRTHATVVEPWTTGYNDTRIVTAVDRVTEGVPPRYLIQLSVPGRSGKTVIPVVVTVRVSMVKPNTGTVFSVVDEKDTPIRTQSYGTTIPFQS